jgi:hypothetical protein
MLFSCNYSILYNPYKLLNNDKIWGYSSILKIRNNSLRITTSRIESRYYKKGSQILFFTHLINDTQDTILVDKNTFYIVSSSGDTSKLLLLNTKKFNNPNLKISPQSDVEAVMVFQSKRRYSYEQYKNEFKNDTIYLCNFDSKTDFALKGDYIKRDRVDY